MIATRERFLTLLPKPVEYVVKANDFGPVLLMGLTLGDTQELSVRLLSEQGMKVFEYDAEILLRGLVEPQLTADDLRAVGAGDGAAVLVEITDEIKRISGLAPRIVAETEEDAATAPLAETTGSSASSEKPSAKPSKKSA
jgi:hypothetical protein